MNTGVVFPEVHTHTGLITEDADHFLHGETYTVLTPLDSGMIQLQVTLYHPAYSGGGGALVAWGADINGRNHTRTLTHTRHGTDTRVLPCHTHTKTHSITQNTRSTHTLALVLRRIEAMTTTSAAMLTALGRRRRR